MSDFEIKDGSVFIFKNENDNENAPKYKGYGKYEGKDIQISLWVKDGSKGKFFSGRIEPKYVPNESSDLPEQDDVEQDLPF